MKKLSTIYLVAVFGVGWGAPSYGGQVSSCTTVNSFNETCTTGQSCCPNSNYILNYSCPSGWTLSGTTCNRSSASGSDDTGYYTQNYGSCTATSTREGCCTVKNSTDTTCISCWRIQA